LTSIPAGPLSLSPQLATPLPHLKNAAPNVETPREECRL
jgi:hypothetical protein